MAEWVETYRGAVYRWQEDHNGHMNVTHYVAKFDEGTWQFLAMLGLNRGYMDREKRGMAAVQQNITYKRELVAGDTVYVETELREMSARKLRYVHRMIDAQTSEEVAEMELTGVHIDAQTRRACPFPDAIRATGARFLGARA
ncbi:MAG: acyl-CoA thioesterase [Alphaproteobacteria bacterium]